MTVAAQQALVLQRHLQRRGLLPTRGIISDFARVVDGPWELARGADLELPAVPGRRPWPQRLMAAYIAHLHAAAAHDERLATAFVRVSGMVDRPRRCCTRAGAARAVGFLASRSRSARTASTIGWLNVITRRRSRGRTARFKQFV